MSGWYGKEYVPVSVKKERAAKNIAKLRKKNPNIAPIVLEGRKLARTWWGIAWNENLERYADYANRIERGRSYVRHGAVLDLQIEPGMVKALVQGSRVTPYKVEISIKPLKGSAWEKVVATCSGSISSLEELVSGKFPKDLADLFTKEGDGLFPTPREIGLGCSCPDWASMCKHVAAALYGVGARLDEDPTLFFKLRQIDINDLISDTLIQTSDAMLEKSQTVSARSLGADDLSSLFNIDLADAVDEVEAEPAPKKRGRPPKAKDPEAEKPVKAVAEADGDNETKPTPKKRGRPPKAKATENPKQD